MKDDTKLLGGLQRDLAIFRDTWMDFIHGARLTLA